MKHQVHFGTDSGIVSTQAATQITMLIADLTRTVDVLDACIAAEENRLRPDDAIELDTRRHNLMVTIASLEDRLGSIEKMRSREYDAPAHSTLRARAPHGLKAMGLPRRKKSSQRLTSAKLSRVNCCFTIQICRLLPETLPNTQIGLKLRMPILG